MSQKTRDLRAQGRDVVSLTLGEPDFDTPLFIQEAATAAMRAGLTHYSPVAGIPELRAAVAHKLKTENGLALRPEPDRHRQRRQAGHRQCRLRH